MCLISAKPSARYRAHTYIIISLSPLTLQRRRISSLATESPAYNCQRPLTIESPVPLDLHSLLISERFSYSHVRFKILFSYEERDTANMSKDVNQCPMTRLVHADTLSLQEVRLDCMPRYLALSHVWSEGLFPPTMVHNMTESRGL